MERGYVKLWRKTLDSGLLQHPTALQVFVWLMLNACRMPRKQIMKGVVFELNPGDVLMSLRSLAEQLGLTLQKIRTALTVLENMEILTRKTTQQATHISIINWDRYQNNQHTANTQDNTQPTHSQHTGGAASSNINKNERIKEIKSNSSCAELSDESSTREKEPENTLPLQPVISLPLNTGEEHPVLQGEVEQWQDLYPAVDVMQQLRNMRGWLEANPARRKTKRGINRFIHHWLADKQDKGGGNARASPQQPATPTEYQKTKQEQRDMAVFLLERNAKKQEAQNGKNAVIDCNPGKYTGSQSRISGREPAGSLGDAG